MTDLNTNERSEGVATEPGATALEDRGFAGLWGVGRADVTPSLDVYSRCWGASKNDRMTGVHRPLTATALVFASEGDDEKRLVLVALDASWWQADDERAFRDALLKRFSLDEDALMVSLSHSHAAPPLNSELTDRPGGEALAEYTRSLASRVAPAIENAFQSLRPGFLTAHEGRCDLARRRDQAASGGRGPLVGFSPEGYADDRLLALRLTDVEGRILALGVNYACHPTTLAFGNQQFSPDFVGAFRQTVEAAYPGCHAFFLQGASGDLAPPYQYHGDADVADNYGRKIAYATLSAVVDRPPFPSRLRFDSVIQSGADLAIWKPERVRLGATLAARFCSFRLPIQQGFPDEAALLAALDKTTDAALRERLRRKLGLRRTLGQGEAWGSGVWLWRLGNVIFAGAPFEAYSEWQRVLRDTFPEACVVVMNLVNGSAGYLPPRAAYDDPALYSVWQTPFAPDGLETLIHASRQGAAKLLKL